MVSVGDCYHSEMFSNLNSDQGKAELGGIYVISNLVKEIFWHLGACGYAYSVCLFARCMMV